MAEGLAGAVQAGLDCGDFGPADGGGFFEGLAFELGEDEGLALERRQGKNGGTDEGGGLGGVGEGGWFWLIVYGLEADIEAVMFEGQVSRDSQ